MVTHNSPRIWLYALFGKHEDQDWLSMLKNALYFDDLDITIEIGMYLELDFHA